MRYSLSTEATLDGVQKNLTIFVKGQKYLTDNSNPYWGEIEKCLEAGRDYLIPRFIDLASRAQRQFNRVTDRVAVNGTNVTFDGDVIHSSLADAIIRALRENDDVAPLARFMDKVYQNPNKHSRENLYDWLSTHAFTITDAGNLLGYKSVSGDLKSHHSGPGIVNGEHVDGHLDNSIGNTIELRRSKVESDSFVGCASGLHVGTFAYAKGFYGGSTILQVEVNPRDVVSVPTDCDSAKMRVCRYRVVSRAGEAPVTTLVVNDDNDWEGWDE